MKTHVYKAVAKTLLLSLSVSTLALSSAMAQSATAVKPADVADAKATVPVVAYRSVFREISLGIELEKLDWRKTNNEVGRLERGHGYILNV